MMSDGFFFLAIFFAIFVGWVATGGPNRPISFAGPYITPITNVGQTQAGYGSLTVGHTTFTGTGPSASGSTGNTQQDIWNAQAKLATLQKNLRSSQLFGTPSPYVGEVSITTGNVSTTNPDQEYVSLYANSSAKGGVDITGWEIVSVATDDYGYIPPGVTLFHSGQVNPTSDIVLNPGDRVTVTTGESPVGVSFKQNECSGYLSQSQTFSPSLSSSCPLPNDEFNRYYTGNDKNTLFCQQYIKTVPECRDPEEPASGVGDLCISFIDQYLTYNGCVATHQGDRGFPVSQWRVYLGRKVVNTHTDRQDLWEPSHDVLKLLDKDGKTVAQYSY
jgi:hypothetical protein